MLFDPELTFDWELTGGVTFSYGFDLQVSLAILNVRLNSDHLLM